MGGHEKEAFKHEREEESPFSPVSMAFILYTDGTAPATRDNMVGDISDY